MHSFFSAFSQSSLVPLAKIANAPSRSLRILWASFTATMFMCLCICIALVVHQYCKHQTVFQLDYSGRHIVYDQIPGLTICPHAQEAHRLFHRATQASSKEHLPWQDKTLMDEFRRKIRLEDPHISFDVISHRLAPGELTWSTAKTAKSPAYRLLQNFTIRFRMQPTHLADNYRLLVMEQVPNKRTFLCTTFELRSHTPYDIWSHLEIEIDQSDSLDGHYAPFTMIVHERGDLPFSAYDRHIHTVLHPNTEMSIYFSKSVTTRLNTARNPCHQGLDAKTLAVDYVGPHEVANSEQFDWMNHSVQANSWYTDVLDRSRLSQNSEHTSSSSKTRQLTRKTVRLFGTEFLYSRESCGWKECCRKVSEHCNCSCSLQVLSEAIHHCPRGCEVQVCQNSIISYKTCPQPCVMIKFIKRNEITMPGTDVNLPVGRSRLKLVRSEAVHVATEEEIFSLAKLFSEVGGLCSLFIGFSCIFLFELLEAAILYKNQEPKKINMLHGNNQGDLAAAPNKTAPRKNSTVTSKTNALVTRDVHANSTDGISFELPEPTNSAHMGNCTPDELPSIVECPTWDGDILVIPLRKSKNGNLEMKLGLEQRDISGNAISSEDISDVELLELLQEGRIRLQLALN